MQTKIVKRKDIYEYVTILPGAKYDRIHAFKQDKKYVVFAGEPFGERVELIVHDRVDSVDILALQIVLSYGQRVKYRQHILCIMMHRPSITMYDMCQLLHCSAPFIEKQLGMVEQDHHGRCLSNVYNLSRVKKPSELLKLQSKQLSAFEFGPLCLQAMIEERKRRK